jgi:GTPase Era involved in 16S rRNA processing
MTPAVEQLVREAVEITGAEAPEMLRDDAPVLHDDALSSRDGDKGAFYLVGLIGGKDVGKSALVNALAGRNVTTTTSHGPGTEIAVAYAHASQEPALRALLEREVPGQYRIVTHDIASLKRQVLLDLPDIDSHWQSHPLVTRAMLRHMLFPVWMVSIEKYADRQPQEMLRKVAAGNAPENFVFCLNKVDQLERSSVDAGAAKEIRDDYAGRIAKTLGLSGVPRVFLISAISPERYELPQLRQMLTQQKSDETVRQSKELAAARQDRTLLAWVDGQALPQRAERLARLQQDAEELIAERIGVPLLEGVIPRLLDDPGNRLAMTDEILRDRVARWPLVNLVHTLFTPLMSVWRANVSPAGSLRLVGSDLLIETYLQHDGRPTSALIQAAFAQLRQSQPLVAELYRGNHLWEDMPADLAASDLRHRLAATVDRQRDAAREKLAGGRGLLGAPLRWLLTIGALLWFPIVQPILQVMLTTKFEQSSREIAGLIVSILSGTALLKNVSFLAMWFLVIWLALRWNTQRCVAKLLSKWKSANYPDRSLNLTRETLEWMAGLVDPIRRSRERVESLVQRAKSFKARSN